MCVEQTLKEYPNTHKLAFTEDSQFSILYLFLQHGLVISPGQFYYTLLSVLYGLLLSTASLDADFLGKISNICHLSVISPLRSPLRLSHCPCMR
jgi:hypothetical protein